MKEIYVEQAIYGDKDNGHSSLCKSNLDAALLTFLAKITDLPIHKPPSLELESYYGTHAFGQWMIFTKTMVDIFSHRKGMVFTHCLIIPIKQLPFLSDLNILFTHFFHELPKDRQSLTCVPITLVLKDAAVEAPLPTAKNFINTILSNTANKCWIVPNSYDFLSWYTSLWRTLAPDMRQLLTFRLSFTKEDIELGHYLFYIVPSNLIQKWDKDCLALSDELKNLSIGGQWLLQDREANDFKVFVNDIGAKITSFEDIKYTENAYNLYCRLSDLTAIQKIQIVRLINMISSKPENGKEKKLSILKQIVGKIESRQSLDFILSTGNLSLTSFLEGEKVLSSVLRSNIQSLWLNGSVNEIDEFVRRYQQKSSIAWWTQTVTETMESIFQTFSKDLAAKCWLIWINDPNSLKFCALFLGDDTTWEKQLVDCYPSSKLGESLVQALLSFCASKHAYLLHARLLVSQSNLKKALEKQLRIAPNHRPSIELITNSFYPLEVIGEAAIVSNKLLWEIAGDVKVPWKDFVQKFKVYEEGWRAIGLSKLNQEITVGPERQEVQKMINQIFDRLIQGDEVEENWFNAIVKSSFDNLLNYPKRGQLWDFLPTHFHSSFLKATARSYLFTKSFKVSSQIEQNLLSEILSNQQLSEFFRQGNSSLNDSCDLFEMFPSLTESAMEEYLRVSNKSFEIEEAVRLGKLVLNRRWKKVAQLIYSHARYSISYKAALQICVNLLNFFQRLDARLSNMAQDIHLSKAEWWDQFEDLCNDLYYDEADIKRIYKKVDGDVSHLSNRVSARILWREIISNLQQEPSLKTLYKLLERMDSEKLGNSDLEYLRKSVHLLKS